MASACTDSHNDLSSFAYSEVAIRRRFDLADWVIGALSMLARVDSCTYFGMGFGPSAWVGQAGEKWSLGTPQHGQMNQWEDFVGGELGFVLPALLLVMGLWEFLLGEWISGLVLGVREWFGSLDAWFELVTLFLASDKKACSLLKPMSRTLVSTMCVHLR